MTKSEQLKAEILAIKGNKEVVTREEIYDWTVAHPESALHAELEWDDAKASRHWRLDQIGKLIWLHVRTSDDKPQLVSLNIDRKQPGMGRRALDEVMSSPELRRVRLEDALRELRHIAAKYAEFAELQPVFAAIDRVAKKIAKAA